MSIASHIRRDICGAVSPSSESSDAARDAFAGFDAAWTALPRSAVP
ncbi:hypothetical protein [Streptomyces sp. SPB162]|nr:hypothetical protein [Streptomyces sp. SPB162]